MTNTKPKHVFQERDELRRENERLRDEIGTLRKVADAAEQFVDASDAWKRFDMDGPMPDGWWAEFEVAIGNQATTRLLLGEAVREYRQHIEPPPLSPQKQAELNRALADLDEKAAAIVYGRTADAEC